jgi:hypothetical protein
MTNGNKTPEPNDPERQAFPDWAVALITIFFLTMIAFDFFGAPDELSFSPSILIAMALVIVMMFASSFDNLSVGQLISLKRNVKEEKDKRAKAEGRAEQLSMQLISLANTTSVQSQSSQTTNNFYNPQAVPATPEEAAEDDNEKRDDLSSQVSKSEEDSAGDTVTSSSIPRRIRRIPDYQRVETLAIDGLAKILGVAESEFSREIKLSDPDMLDRVSSRPAIFDALLQSPGLDRFVEIAVIRSSSKFSFLSRFRDRFSHYLFLLDHYARSRRVTAKLIIVLAVLNEEESSETEYVQLELERMRRHFSPAMSRGLLDIVTVDIDIADVTTKD